MGSNSIQQVNKKKMPGKSSKYFGVTWHEQKGNWLARITVRYTEIYVGSFKNERDAGVAVIKALMKYWGNDVRIEDQKLLGIGNS